MLSRTDLATEFRRVPPGGASRLIQYFSCNNPRGAVPLITTCPPAHFPGKFSRWCFQLNNHKNKHLTAGGWLLPAGSLSMPHSTQHMMLVGWAVSRMEILANAAP